MLDIEEMLGRIQGIPQGPRKTIVVTRLTVKEKAKDDDATNLGKKAARPLVLHPVGQEHPCTRIGKREENIAMKAQGR